MSLIPPALVRAVVVLVALVAASCSGSSTEAANDRLPTDPVELQAASAAAMGEVTSVRFSLIRGGGPVYIDAADSIGLDDLEGRFAAPASADAVLAVTVNDALRTRIGAVAIDEEIWLSNPVTGKFETLPGGFDIDPSSFFDPKGGWQPLLESILDVRFLGEEDRGDGVRYHLSGTAPAAEISAVTAGLVGAGGDVDIELWLHPVSALVTDLEFETDFGGEQTSWILKFTDYGESFTITDPTLGE